MYSFGNNSQENLDTCDYRIRKVLKRALAYGIMDFSVIEGHRSIERQQELYNQDPPVTHIDGITQKGKHNYSPSMAVDLMPWPRFINSVNVWDDARRFSVLAGVILAAAKEEGVKLRWGGDWDGDGNNEDSTLDDLPHFEIVE